MPAISFTDVTKVFETSKSAGTDGQRPAAVRDVSFEVEQGEFVVLLGPSGCGKTTLMRMVNRLIEPTSGSIHVEGREVHDIPVTELRRHIGYVIQQVGLFPHMTVAQNIAVVPKLLGWSKSRTESARTNSWIWSLFHHASTASDILDSCPADSNSVWASPVPWRRIHKSC